MEGVRVGELPVDLRGEHSANGGLAGTGRAHDDDDHNSLSWSLPSDLTEEFAEQHVEMVDTVFALHGVTPTVVGRRAQTALDVFAEADVFLLHFVAEATARLMRS